jgi:hypothetical protein
MFTNLKTATADLRKHQILHNGGKKKAVEMKR